MALERGPEADPMPAEAERPAPALFNPGRQILIIGVGLVALIVITVVAVLLVGSPTASFPEDSAERALQRYLEALEDEDYDTAYGFFAARVQEEMSPEEFRESAEFYPDFSGGERRVRIERTDETVDGVRLHLVVEEFYGDGFGSSGYSFERDVRMTRESGEWKIDERMIGLDQDSGIEFEEPPTEPMP